MSYQGKHRSMRRSASTTFRQSPDRSLVVPSLSDSSLAILSDAFYNESRDAAAEPHLPHLPGLTELSGLRRSCSSMALDNQSTTSSRWPVDGRLTSRTLGATSSVYPGTGREVHANTTTNYTYSASGHLLSAPIINAASSRTSESVPKAYSHYSRFDVMGATARETAARLRLARVQRQLQKKALVTAVSGVKERKARAGSEVRRDLDERVGRDVTQRIAQMEPATDDEVEALSVMFNKRLIAQMDLPKSTSEVPSGSWYRLFRRIDLDDSGRISFAELEQMARGELGLGQRLLPDRRLKALWKALDEDASGFISAGEFGRFMRHGYNVGPALRSRRANEERHQSRKARERQRFAEHERNRLRAKVEHAALSAARLEEECERLEAALEKPWVGPAEKRAFAGF